MANHHTLFDDEFLRKLEYLKIVSRHLLPGHLKGEHRARKTGSGVEFADYRPYVSGDDTRNLDWRTYLRLNKLIIRLFQEEADLPIYIFIDSSRSMDYGEPSKFDYARKVAAALCYIGLLNLDRVNLIVFADGVAQEMSGRGKNQIHRAFRFLENAPPRGTTYILNAFKTFFSTKRRRGLAVVISDFYDPNGVENAFNLLRYYRHDVFALRISSSSEARPELPDEVVLVDSENGASEHLKISPALLGAYALAFANHSREIESYCWRYGWGYLQATTQIPFEDLILQVFRQDRFLR